MKVNIGIVGSGSWGLALAIALSKSNCKVTLFFNSEDSLSKAKINRTSKFLTGVKIPKKINITGSYKDLYKTHYIFLVTPSQKIRENIVLIKQNLGINKKFVICSKGIENRTNKLMSEVLLDIMPGSVPTILSGPNFSDEVAKDLPTAFVLSSKNKGILLELGNAITNKNFRPYFNNDIIGTQIGGALQNVIAIACGIVSGRGLGENARSSVMTRGLKEIITLGIKMGADEKTFKGLSGLGDLNLSCNSLKSRNMNLGYKLGKKFLLSEIILENNLSEGLNSCKAICALGKEHSVDLPICNAVKEILDGKSISNVIYNLLSRPLQFEI